MLSMMILQCPCLRVETLNVRPEDNQAILNFSEARHVSFFYVVNALMESIKIKDQDL